MCLFKLGTHDDVDHCRQVLHRHHPVHQAAHHNREALDRNHHPAKRHLLRHAHHPTLNVSVNMWQMRDFQFPIKILVFIVDFPKWI